MDIKYLNALAETYKQINAPQEVEEVYKGKMDRGTRADLEYRKANLKKEELELDQIIESLVERGHTEQEAYALLAQFTLDEGIRDKDPEKGTKERKERLEKKRGHKVDDHPEYKMEGYQRNPEKGEKEDKKYAPVRGEKTPMPPRGDKRREDFEKWYAKQMGR